MMQFDFQGYFASKYLNDERILELEKAEVLKEALKDMPEGMRRLRLRCLGKEARLLQIINEHEDFKYDKEINQKLLKLLTSGKDLEVFKWGADLLLKLDRENINLCNQDGETLLHLAATFYDADSISSFIRMMNHQQVGARNSRGEPFLHYLLRGAEMSISRQESKEREDAYLDARRLVRYSDLHRDPKALEIKARQRAECFRVAISEIFAKYKGSSPSEHRLVKEFFAPTPDLKDWEAKIEEKILKLQSQLTKESRPFLQSLFLVVNFLSNKLKTEFVRRALSINNQDERVNIEHLQVLLDCEFDLNFRFSDSPESQTLLMRCARYEEIKTVAVLCRSRKVDINAADLDGRSALHFALEVGSVEVANILIDAGINLEYVRIDPSVGAPGLLQILRRKLSEAQSTQDQEAYRVLYSKIAQKIIDQNTGGKGKISKYIGPIFEQFMEGKFDVLKAVLKNGGTEKSEIETDEEFEVLMKTLFALGLPKQTKVPTSIGTIDNLFTYAFRSGNYSFAALLANDGGTLDISDADKEKLLFAAVRRVIGAEKQEKTDALDFLETILKCKIDPNAKSSHFDIFRGATPLLIAAQNQDLELARLLVAYGADLDLRMEIKGEDGLVKETCVKEYCKERGKESFFKKLEKVKKEKERREQGALGGTAKEESELAPRPRGGAASSEAAAAAADDTVSMISGVSRVVLLTGATASRFVSLSRRSGAVRGGDGDC